MADSIKYKKPLESNQFVTSILDSSEWMVPTQDGTSTEVNAGKKRIAEMKVEHLVKYQSQQYQSALTFVQTLWNTVYGQYLEPFQLAMENKGSEL